MKRLWVHEVCSSSSYNKVKGFKGRYKWVNACTIPIENT
jgi:hypothetical protein